MELQTTSPNCITYTTGELLIELLEGIGINLPFLPDVSSSRSCALAGAQRCYEELPLIFYSANYCFPAGCTLHFAFEVPDRFESRL